MAGETHLTEVNKDLTDELVVKGYKLIRSRGTAQQVQIIFGGLYFGTEDKATGRYTEHGGTTGKLDPTVPWTKREVRQAMNKAINREELRRVLCKGRADYMYVHGFYPDLPGWDPTWEQRFSEMYGYDPETAKHLLAAAGYPNGFKAKAWLYPFAGAPELIPLMEAVQIQLREVGIELELEEADVAWQTLGRLVQQRGATCGGGRVLKRLRPATRAPTLGRCVAARGSARRVRLGNMLHASCSETKHVDVPLFRYVSISDQDDPVANRPRGSRITPSA